MKVEMRQGVAFHCCSPCNWLDTHWQRKDEATTTCRRNKNKQEENNNFVCNSKNIGIFGDMSSRL